MVKKSKAINTDSQSITPQKAVQLLKEQGAKVTEDEAKMILEIMYKIANLSVKHYIKL